MLPFWPRATKSFDWIIYFKMQNLETDLGDSSFYTHEYFVIGFVAW